LRAFKPIKNIPDYHAFTIRANGTLSAIVTEIGVSLPQPTNIVAGGIAPSEMTLALWDTGAECSVINEATAKKLGLQPFTFAKVFGVHGAGDKLKNVYLVDLFLPNRIAVQGVRVVEGTITHGAFEILIGMDIMTLGDVSLTHVGGQTVFSFRMPSIQAIDYLKAGYGGRMAGKPI